MIKNKIVKSLGTVRERERELHFNKQSAGLFNSLISSLSKRTILFVMQKNEDSKYNPGDDSG